MSNNMPNMAVSNAEKDSYKFGLEFGRYIETQWMHGRRDINAERIRLLRDHLEGTVNTDRFKPMFTTSEDASALNLDWTYQSDIPRFITSITEGFSYDMYRTYVKGIDAYSSKQRTQFKTEKTRDLYTKDVSAKLSDMFGEDFMPKGYQPKSLEELNIYMELEYKQGHEIALEIGIQKVMDVNDWREVFNHLVEELALIGRGVIKTEYDSDKVIKMRVVPYERMIHSIDLDNSRDRRGTYYFGEVRTLTVADVARLTGGNLTSEQLQQLAAMSKTDVRGYRSIDEFDDDMLDKTVTVIQFCFNTHRDRIYKKKGNRHGKYKMLRKEDDWRPAEGSMAQLVNSPYEVWYEGTYVCGTDIMLTYGLMDNIARDPKSKRKALPPYAMYKLSTESIGSRIASICDDIYVTKIKIRQLQQKLRPSGVAIDIDGLSEVKLSSGQTISPIEQIRIFNEDGNLLYSGQNLIDEMGGSRLPLKEIPGSTGQDLQQLVNIYNTYVNQLHEITGINQQAVGGAPPARTSSAVYQGTINSAQKVVNNIYNGMLNIQQRVAEVIVSRLQNAALRKDTKKIVDALLGEYTTDIISDMAQLHMYQYVLGVDVKPTDEERARLIQDLSLALQSGAISIVDKIDIENIDNIKLARQMIKIRDVERKKEAEKMEAIKTQNRVQEINAQKQAELEALKYKSAIETEQKLAEINAKGQITAFEWQARMQETSLKGQWDMEIAKIQSGAKYQLDSEKEDRKDKRQRELKTMESEMIEQRKGEASPKDFTEPDIPTLAAPPNVTQNQ
jgi:hypothetical protein